MSVANPVIDRIDGPPNVPAVRIYLLAGVRSFHPVEDIYKEVRQRRLQNEAIRAFEHFAEAGGYIPKGGGKFTPRYLILKHGAKIVPDNASHTLDITGEVFTDDLSPVFDTSGLSAGVSIFFNYAPPEAEVIEVNTAGGGGATASEVAQAVWTYGGRSLTSFGSLVTDVASAVWGVAVRTITSRPPNTASDAVDAVVAGTGTEVIAADTASEKAVVGTYGDVILTRTLDKTTGNVSTTRS